MHTTREINITTKEDRRQLKFLKIISKDTIFSLLLVKSSELLILQKILLNNILPWSMIIMLERLTPFIDLRIYPLILSRVMSQTFIKYPTQFASIVVFWNLTCLIPPTDAQLIKSCQSTRKMDTYNKKQNITQISI